MNIGSDHDQRGGRGETRAEDQQAAIPNGRHSAKDKRRFTGQRSC